MDYWVLSEWNVDIPLKLGQVHSLVECVPFFGIQLCIDLQLSICSPRMWDFPCSLLELHTPGVFHWHLFFPRMAVHLELVTIISCGLMLVNSVHMYLMVFWSWDIYTKCVLMKQVHNLHQVGTCNRLERYIHWSSEQVDH